MSENKLKPCPLCGGIDLLANVEYIPKGKGKGINVGFVECLTEKCPMMIRAETVEEAIYAWNKRPEEEKLEKEKIKIQNDLMFAYQELSGIKYIFSQMCHSIERDKMVYNVAKEAINKLDGNRRQGKDNSYPIFECEERNSSDTN